MYMAYELKIRSAADHAQIKQREQTYYQRKELEDRLEELEKKLAKLTLK